MNADKVNQITEAAARKAEAQMAFESLGLLNVQSDPEKRKEQEIAYRLAQAELNQAIYDLDEAIKPDKKFEWPPQEGSNIHLAGKQP